MSIIYEALKKIEKEENAAGGQLKRKTFVPPRRRQTLKFKSNFVFFVLTLAAVVSLYMFIQKYSQIEFNRPSASAPQEDKGSIYLPRVQPANRAAPLPAKAQSKPLVAVAKIKQNKKYYLQGIIYDDARPLALINGKKVGLGETIDEARLTRVSRAGVEIETKTGRVFLSWDYE